MILIREKDGRQEYRIPIKLTVSQQALYMKAILYEAFPQVPP